MQSSYSHNQFFPNLRRVQQISVCHCGPAVLEMLLSHLGRHISQQQLVQAGGVTGKISEFGLSIPDLVKCLATVAPDLRLWYKEGATIDDIYRLIHNYNVPVGIEWQGNFKSEDDDGDYGHYSVVLEVNEENMTITLADPYYPAHDRVFSIKDFEADWWDTNEVVSPITGVKKPILDYHMMFVVVPQAATFPDNLGMKRG